MTYILQVIFMLIAFCFMSFVLREQWLRYRNTRTEYIKSRQVLLVLVSLIFVGNFSHIEPGHLIHSILLALVGFTWWYWYRIIAEELIDKDKLATILRTLTGDLAAEAIERKAQLQSVQIHQEAQSEAIAELSPKTAQKINDLTAIKDIKKVEEINNGIDK